MKTAKEWADALIAARPAMVAGQDPVDFADAFAGIIATIQDDAHAAGYRAGLEAACTLVASRVEQYGAALRAIRALIPDGGK